MPKIITEAQEIQLNIIEKASFNDMDGYKIVKDLRDNQQCWQAAMIFRDEAKLITLRDLDRNYLNLDTIYISVALDFTVGEVASLAKNWLYDEMVWLDKSVAMTEMGSGNPPSVLKLWWD